MVATIRDGQRSWSGNITAEGHREYTITHLVDTDDVGDGPAIVMQTPGLPAVGSQWRFDNDIDIWAFCQPYMKVSIHQEKKGDPNFYWKVEQKFSTVPRQRCHNTTITDPLLEPTRVGGSFVKYTQEATRDKDNNPILYSSHEPIRGPGVEFDESRPTVQIGNNYLNLALSTFSSMLNTVNSVPMWGLPTRTVKLSNVSWTRNLYGVCYYYYTVDYEFDINFNTFDRLILDEGTKALNGRFDPDTGDWVLKRIGGDLPDPDNPNHFVRIKDLRHENIRAPLNGAGLPAGVRVVTGTAGTGTGGTTTQVAYKLVQKYKESNFFTLGKIPISF